jgi:cell shape-determining protein MreC
MSSQRKYSILLISAGAVLLALIFFEPAYGWRVRTWLSNANNIAPAAQMAADDPVLAAQNEILQAKLAELQAVAAQMPQFSGEGIRAMVYAQYPFGFKNNFFINAGSQDGVLTGKAVIFQGIFIGDIIQVFPDYAEVQTVFDPGFKLPIRIGSQSADGLLVGGAYPKATSISKSAVIPGGSIVSLDAPGLPYGLPIGTVDATSTSPDNLFQEASLNFAYDINTVQTVLVAR